MRKNVMRLAALSLVLVLLLCGCGENSDVTVSVQSVAGAVSGNVFEVTKTGSVSAGTLE